MTGLTVHVHAESALDVARRNAFSCQEIIKVGVESGANNEFKGVNNSYLHEEGGGGELPPLCLSTRLLLGYHYGCGVSW